MLVSIFERVRWLRVKCSRLFRRGEQEAALKAEMEFHFEQLVREFRADGMSERDARLAAQREFGATEVYREEARDTWRPWALADFGRTLKFAMRSLLRSRSFTLIGIVTLALGIGVNTALFSVLNEVVLKPLPYRNSEQLERIDRATPQNREGRVSPADFLDLQREADRYGAVAAYALGETSLSEPGQPAEIVVAAQVTPNLLSLLGGQPQFGRDFRPEEATPGENRLVILSQRLWRNRFGGLPEIVGRTIRVDGEPHAVIGVMPESFSDWRYLGTVDLFRPLVFDESMAADRRSTILRVVGRRAALLSHAEAAVLIENFGARLSREHPQIHEAATWRTVLLNDVAVGGKSTPTMLAMLIGLSGFVLLIACSNLANLFLARTIARAREFAVRAALGASRGQLLRPLIAEALLLALAGGICAIFVSVWTADWMCARSADENGGRVVVALNWKMIAWAFGAALGTALAFGLAPALFALRLNLNDTLKSGGRGATATRGHQLLRQLLIVGQFAFAMILLAGAALFIRGFEELNQRRAGWESDQLITGTLVLPAATYADEERINEFHRVALQRIEALPGVASASVSAFTPLFNWADVREFVVDGRPRPPRGHGPAAVVNSVSANYFSTVGTRVLVGRSFDARDTAVSPRVVIINQAMAKALFGNENALGRRIAQAEDGAVSWAEIVGVAADVKSALPNPDAITHQLYQPITQAPGRRIELAVRAEGEASAALVESIRASITALDSDLPVRKLRPAEVSIDRANHAFGVLRELLSAFAILGLALASVGVYGVIARTMAQRSSEFAIRMALGACVRDITRLVLTSGVKLAMIGAVFGMVGAIGVTKVIAANFSGIQLNSPLVLLGTVAVLVAVALAACWLPARRAGKVDAMMALRVE